MKNTHSRRDFIGKSIPATFLGVGGLATFGTGLEEAVAATPAKSSAPSELKITGIKCGYIRRGSGLFVKIYTNQDIWGCGEGVDAVPGTYHFAYQHGQ